MAKIKVKLLAAAFDMDTKEVLSKLNAAGIKAIRSNSSVDEGPAKVILSAKPPTNVVSLDQARKEKAESKVRVPKTTKAKGPKPGAVGSPEWHAKYPHVVKGSVRDATPEDKREMGSRCHGRVCTVECVDTGEKRTINTQDAFQVKRSAAAQREFLKLRRSQRRVAKREARKVAQSV